MDHFWFQRLASEMRLSKEEHLAKRFLKGLAKQQKRRQSVDLIRSVGKQLKRSTRCSGQKASNQEDRIHSTVRVDTSIREPVVRII